MKQKYNTGNIITLEHYNIITASLKATPLKQLFIPLLRTVEGITGDAERLLYFPLK